MALITILSVDSFNEYKLGNPNQESVHHKSNQMFNWKMSTNNFY